MVDYIRRLALEGATGTSCGHRAAGPDAGAARHAVDAGRAPAGGAAHLFPTADRGERKESVLEILGRWQDLAAECMAFLRRDVVLSMVTIPERLALCQLDGVVEELGRYDLRISRLIVNNVVG